jgi:hypothetical protein
MAKKKAVTGQITKRFTLEELEMIVEAICMYKDAGHRARCAIFDKKGRLVPQEAKEALNPIEFSGMIADGEWILRWAPIGPRFTTEEEETTDELWDAFVTGVGKIEEKIEKNISETVEENIGGVIDDLYTMLKGETK